MFIVIELDDNNLSLLTSFLLYPHLTLFAGFVLPLFFPLILKLHCLTWWRCKHMGYSDIGRYGNVVYLNVKYTWNYTVTSLLMNGVYCSTLLEIDCVKSVQIRSFLWSVFSHIRTEYGEILRISPYSVRMRENTDQKKLRISLCIQSECGKIRTRKNAVFGRFSHCDISRNLVFMGLKINLNYLW